METTLRDGPIQTTIVVCQIFRSTLMQRSCHTRTVFMSIETRTYTHVRKLILIQYSASNTDGRLFGVMWCDVCALCSANTRLIQFQAIDIWLNYNDFVRWSAVFLFRFNECVLLLLIWLRIFASVALFEIANWAKGIEQRVKTIFLSDKCTFLHLFSQKLLFSRTATEKCCYV